MTGTRPLHSSQAAARSLVCASARCNHRVNAENALCAAPISPARCLCKWVRLSALQFRTNANYVSLKQGQRLLKMITTVGRVSAALWGLRSATRSSAVGSLTAAPFSSIPEQDAAAASTGSYYWVPHATFTPASVAQRRATGRIEAAIESVLLTDGAIREQLVHRYGLNIHRVMVSKDRRTVFILWDANEGKAQDCQKALEKNAFRLRGALAKSMKAKSTPYLEFRHNHLPPLKAAAAEAMERVQQELSAAEAAAAQKTGNAAQHANVEAAIARLQRQTQQQQH